MVPTDPFLLYRVANRDQYDFNVTERMARRLVNLGYIKDKSDGFDRHDSGDVLHFDDTRPQAQRNSACEAHVRYQALTTHSLAVPYVHG